MERLVPIVARCAVALRAATALTLKKTGALDFSGAFKTAGLHFVVCPPVKLLCAFYSCENIIKKPESPKKYE
jgi:hypothetical protein